MQTLLNNVKAYHKKMNDFNKTLQLFGHVGTDADKKINDTDSNEVKTAKAYAAN
jgi:hypothetical protein